jgi:hypothetical protein
MIILEATRTGDNAFAALEKGFVVKSGAGYRAQQGSDYEPGASAETVGSKSIWLGMITLPPGTRARCTSIMKPLCTCSAAMKWNCGWRSAAVSRHGASGRLHLHSRKHLARRHGSRRAIRGAHRLAQRSDGSGKCGVPT